MQRQGKRHTRATSGQIAYLDAAMLRRRETPHKEQASMAHAAKNAEALEGSMKTALKKQGLKTPSVRDKLGGSVGKGQPAAGKGQSVS